MKSSLFIWSYEVNLKSTVKISSIFVAFLENRNFIRFLYIKFRYSEKATKISSVKLLVEDGTIFCDLLRISELYLKLLLKQFDAKNA